MTTFHVRPHVGSDGNPGTSFDKAWQTLGAALTRYKAGDTVTVWGGTHAPGTINRPLTLDCRNGASINGKLSNAQHGLLIRASYVTVSGLTVVGARGAGIASTDAHHVKVVRCGALRNGGHGISMIRGDYLTVGDCDVIENIGSADRAMATVSGISIFNPTPFASGEDVAWRIKVTNNRIRGNGTTAKTDGYGVILDKFASENPTPYFAQSLVADNLISANWNGAIYLFHTDNVDVLRNRCEFNGTDQTKKWATEIGVQRARAIRVRGNYARTGRYCWYSGGPSLNTVTFANNDFGPSGRILSPFSGAGQVGP